MTYQYMYSRSHTVHRPTVQAEAVGTEGVHTGMIKIWQTENVFNTPQLFKLKEKLRDLAGQGFKGPGQKKLG